MQAVDIDTRLWSYIDGDCSTDEREQIAQLIAQNSAWAQQYESLLMFHKSLQTDLEAEQTSPAFTDDVMKQIDSPAVLTIKTQVLTWGIRAVASFFIISIASLLIYFIATTDFSHASSNNPDNALTIPENVQLTLRMFTGFALLILLLVSADSLFRRRLAH